MWDSFNITRTAAKYQYATFIGVYAGAKNDVEQCRSIFSKCPVTGQEFLDVLAEKLAICAKEMPISDEVEMKLSSPVRHFELH